MKLSRLYEDLSWIKTPEEAYRYAFKPQGEKYERCPQVEPIVMRSPRWAFFYARDVIRDRWPEAEPAIMRSPMASAYAREIIKDRWPEAEPFILQDEPRTIFFMLRTSSRVAGLRLSRFCESQIAGMTTIWRRFLSPGRGSRK